MTSFVCWLAGQKEIPCGNDRLEKQILHFVQDDNSLAVWEKSFDQDDNSLVVWEKSFAQDDNSLVVWEKSSVRMKSFVVLAGEKHADLLGALCFAPDGVCGGCLRIGRAMAMIPLYESSMIR